MMRLIVVIALSLVTAACGGRGLVRYEEPVEAPFQEAETARVVFYDSGVLVPSDVDKVFRNQLENKLFFRGGFREGTDGIIVAYRYQNYADGRVLPRIWSLGIADEAEEALVVEAVVLSPEGERAGSIIVKGRQRLGITEGFDDGAYEEAAEEVAEYVIAHYRKPCFGMYSWQGRYSERCEYDN